MLRIGSQLILGMFIGLARILNASLRSESNICPELETQIVNTPLLSDRVFKCTFYKYRHIKDLCSRN